MRILQISEFYPPEDVGGAEIHVANLVDGLKKRGHDVLVASFSTVPGVQTIKSDERNFRNRYWERYQRPEYFTSYGALKAYMHGGTINEIVKNARADIVHIHNIHDYSTTHMCILAARRSGSKLVWTAHDNWFACPYSTMLDTRSRQCHDRRCWSNCFSDRPVRHRMLAYFLKSRTQYLKNVDRIIAPSHNMASRLEDWGVKNIEIIPYGHPSEPYIGIKPKEQGGPLRLLFAGALEPHKDPMTLLNAVGNCKKVSLRFVGSGTLERRLKKAIEEKKIQAKVIPRVRHEYMPEHYEWADALVVPSIWPDNQPISIIEAMLSSRAVIASAVGGIPEMISHNKTGILFNPGDPRALGNIIKKLTHDKVRKMGAKARETALATYDMDRYIDRIIKLYEEIP